MGSPGLARHLAGTFGDKATSFSQRREQQSAAAEGDSIAQGLLGGQAGLTAGIAATPGTAAANSSDSSGAGAGPGSSSGGPGVTDSRSSIEGSSMLAPDPAGHMAPVSVSTEASQQQQAEDPSATAAAARHAGSHIGLQGRSDSCSSTGSGSLATLPQHEGSPDMQLKAK
jgi:hypothetical protein